MKLYKLLEISSNATQSQIKKAYYKLAKKYHPDKTGGKDSLKFQQINYAYNILINPETREKYHMLNENDDSNFMEYLVKISEGNLSKEDLLNLNISIDSLLQKTLSKFNIGLDNMSALFKNLDITQIFKIFSREDISVNKCKEISNFSDSEVDQFVENDANYYFDLPLKYFDYNSNNIEIEIDVTLDNIFKKEKKKIKIMRSIDGIDVKQKFVFNINSPYVIFHGCGDVDNKKNGDLIINLKLDNSAMWSKDAIIYNYNISLYQYIYGLDLNINLSNNELCYKNWIPNRDGNMILLNDKMKNKNEYKIIIKFNVEYIHNEKLHHLLSENFS